jgi:hypothetical protein
MPVTVPSQSDFAALEAEIAAMEGAAGGIVGGPGASIAMLGEQALRRLGVAVVPIANRPVLNTVVTVADIATRALLALAVIASDETPSDIDLALAVSKVNAVHDSMVAQAFIPWASTAIPQAAAEEYAYVAAVHLASAFGKPADPARLPALEGRVKTIALLLSAPTLATGAVLSVHQDLAARGLLRWSIFDIPAALQDVYSYLGAYQLAPLFGKVPSDKDAEQANQSLYRYIALPTSGERVHAEFF